MRGNNIRNNIVALALAGLFMMPAEMPLFPPVADAVAQTPRSKKKSGGKSGKSAARKGSSGQTKGKKKGDSGSAKGNKRRKGSGNGVMSSAEATRRKEAAEREITKTKEEIRENEKKIRTGLSELSRIQSGIDASSRQVGTLSAKVKTLSGKIDDLRGEVAKGEKEVAKMRAEYLKAVKKMRARRGNTSMLAFIFSSENFNQALRRMRYLRQFSKWKERKSAEINVRVASLRGQQKELQDTRTLQTQLLSKEEKVRRQLDGQRREQGLVVAELRRNGDALNSHLAKKQAEANALKGQIASLIAAEERKRAAAEEQRRREAEAREQEKARAEQERVRQEQAAKEERLRAEEEARQIEAEKKMNEQERKKAEKERKAKARKEAREREEKAKREKKLLEKQRKEQEKKEEAARRRQKNESAKPAPAPSQNAAPKPASRPSAGGNFAAAKGSLPRPVDGAFRVTSQFGRHPLRDLPDVVYDNPGIDAEVAPGATVKAVFPGRVSGVYVIPGFSTVIIINHGEYYTVYGNVGSPSVKIGDNVKQGQALGRLAKDPDDPSHSSVHFEVWKNRDKLNPMNWIR